MIYITTLIGKNSFDRRLPYVGIFLGLFARKSNIFLGQNVIQARVRVDCEDEGLDEETNVFVCVFVLMTDWLSGRTFERKTNHINLFYPPLIFSSQFGHFMQRDPNNAKL